MDKTSPKPQRNGNVCAMFYCKNRSFDKNGKSFYRFPKDKEQCKQWVYLCKRRDIDNFYKAVKNKDHDYMNRTYLLCSDHFATSCFMSPVNKKSGLMKGSIPTLNLPASITHKLKENRRIPKKRLRSPSPASEIVTKTVPVQQIVEPSGALVASAKSEDFVPVKRFLDAGDNSNALDDYDDLMSAAKAGIVESVQKFLDAGADPNSLDEDDNNALMWASLRGHASVVHLLINKAKSSINHTNKWGGSALHWAVFNGHPSVVRLLVESGAKVNECDKLDGFALKYAASNGHLKITAFLLSAGALIDLKGNNGTTALMAAAFKDQASTIPTLVGAYASLNEKNYIGQTALILAARVGRLSALRVLVRAGASMNKSDILGLTSLMMAAIIGDLDSTIFLVESFADVNKRNKRGQTARQLAEINNHLAVAAYLKSHGGI